MKFEDVTTVVYNSHMSRETKEIIYEPAGHRCIVCGYISQCTTDSEIEYAHQVDMKTHIEQQHSSKECSRKIRTNAGKPEKIDMAQTYHHFNTVDVCDICMAQTAHTKPPHKEWMADLDPYEDLLLSECRIHKHAALGYSKVLKGVCRACGQLFTAGTNPYDYKDELPIDWKLIREIQLKFDKHTQTKHKKVYNADELKPWDDQESIFCDTSFLDGLMNKKIARCDEIKGD